ncbi:MAG: hypothetical protein CME70_07130 [Halobacteriovorax sp.]|nr:hypothetical protein [Halobacteriovorax sp.]|tara:strand:+ start:416435 stop:417973 length:1539 start_codon:yes stop_codon:yes gene_type:complete
MFIASGVYFAMSYRPFLIILIFLICRATFGSEIRIGITSVPLNLNPLYATDANSQNINRITHLSLIDFDEKMRSNCDACENFSETISQSGDHEIRFTLKEGIKFWDGKSVTAKNVIDSYKYFIKPENKSNHARAFQNIKSIKIINDLEFIVIFKKYSIENLNNLTLLKILKINTSGEQVGCGEYKILEKSPLKVVLTPAFGESKPNLSFKVVKDETTLALKIVNKELHLSLGGISPRKYKWLKKNTREYEYLEVPGTNYKYISFNHKNIHLSKHNVRKAISKLIPRRELLKYKLHETAILSNGLFSPSFGKFYINSQKVRYSADEATKLLLEEGYKKVKGKWYLNNKPVRLSWRVSNNKATIEIVNLLKDKLAQFGFEIKVSVQEWGTFMKNVKKGNFDLIMGQWIGFTGPDMMRFIWHSDSVPPKGANRGHYINPDFDRALNLAAGKLNENERNSLYKKAQLIAENDFAYLGMWHPNITWIKNKCVKGVKIFPNGGFLGLRDLKLVCNGND